MPKDVVLALDADGSDEKSSFVPWVYSMASPSSSKSSDDHQMVAARHWACTLEFPLVTLQ